MSNIITVHNIQSQPKEYFDILEYTQFVVLQRDEKIDTAAASI